VILLRWGGKGGTENNLNEKQFQDGGALKASGWGNEGRRIFNSWALFKRAGWGCLGESPSTRASPGSNVGRGGRGTRLGERSLKRHIFNASVGRERLFAHSAKVNKLEVRSGGEPKGKKGSGRRKASSPRRSRTVGGTEFESARERGCTKGKIFGEGDAP